MTFWETNFGAFQPIVNKCYVKLFGVDLSEFEDISSYATLQELFVRKFKKKRMVHFPGKLISPADGKVNAMGNISKKKLIIKNKKYTLASLIHEDVFTAGTYMNIYLSPKDYHRFHAPCDLKVISTKKIPGKLYPVNALFAWKRVYAENARTVLECEVKGKKMFLIFVGAYNVGSIIIREKKLFKQGEEIGNFNLGSSIIILCEKDMIKFVEVGNSLKMGDVIAEIN